jgi:hypothetical protein
MSQAAMEAFSQITGAMILSGTMDLGEHEVNIFAIGVKDGLTWEITTRWIGGQPQCLVFRNPRTSL